MLCSGSKPAISAHSRRSDDPTPARSDALFGDFRFFTWSLNAQYYVYKNLGKGGFGTISLARRWPENSVVALKEPVVPPKHPHHASARASLRSEAVVLQALSHRNIIKLLDCFLSTNVDEWGVVY